MGEHKETLKSNIFQYDVWLLRQTRINFQKLKLNNFF